VARLTPFAVWSVVKELRETARDRDAIVVTGAPALAEALRRELGRGAKPGAVREGSLAGAGALVYVFAAPPTPDDERVLQEARRLSVPIVAVLADPGLDDRMPHVLATDVVRIPPGSGFPHDEIARALARRLGEAGTSVAARIPALRRAVSDELIAGFSRTNGILGVAVFVPVASWAVKGAVAYGGTRAIGEAAVRYFEAVSPEEPAAA
jgi:hypothetical protein